MFGVTLLGVLIGLVFLYLLLSTLCSTLASTLANLLKLRSKGLRNGVDQLISEPNLREAFYKHPLITSLVEGRAPIHIPSASYSLALLDVAAKKAQELQAGDQPKADAGLITDVEQLNQLIGKLPESPTRTLLQTFLASSDKKLETVLKQLGGSFDATMQCVSRWYEQQIRWFLLGFAAVVCIGLNLDTIVIAEKLWADHSLRAMIDTAATQYLEKHTSAATTSEDLQQQYLGLAKLNLPMGWTLAKLKAVDDWPSKVAGLLLTILATSAGAPFWYQLLNRLVGFGRPGPEKS